MIGSLQWGRSLGRGYKYIKLLFDASELRRAVIKKKGAIVVAVALIVILAKPQAAFAQVTSGPIRGSWEGIKAAPPGDELAG